MTASTDSPRLRVLVAGCGYVGGALARELAEAGHQVWGLRRSETRIEGVTPIAADLTDPASLEGLPGGIEAVVYAASAGGRGEAAYRAAYLEGLENLLAALERQGGLPRRAIFTSSTGVYGQQDGSWVDEETPAEPARAGGAILREAEERLFASGVREPISLRLAGIYGPGRDRRIRQVEAGEALPSDPPRYGNRIHQRDCAGALHHLLTLPSPQRIYLGTDDAPVTFGEVYAWIAGQLGLPFPPAREGAEAPPPPPPAGRAAGQNKRCRNDRLKASGYTFRVPTYREGYGPMIAARQAR